jgi:hypothetical protein
VNQTSIFLKCLDFFKVHILCDDSFCITRGTLIVNKLKIYIYIIFKITQFSYFQVEFTRKRVKLSLKTRNMCYPNTGVVL